MLLAIVEKQTTGLYLIVVEEAEEWEKSLREKSYHFALTRQLASSCQQNTDP